jgi:hypothetical protein
MSYGELPDAVKESAVLTDSSTAPPAASLPAPREGFAFSDHASFLYSLRLRRQRTTRHWFILPAQPRTDPRFRGLNIRRHGS